MPDGTARCHDGLRLELPEKKSIRRIAAKGLDACALTTDGEVLCRDRFGNATYHDFGQRGDRHQSAL